MAGEQPLAVPQARQDERHAQRQHHGREADPPAGRRELPGVGPPGLPLARPGVDDAAPQPHPLPSFRGQQGEIPGDPQAEHHHLAEPPGMGDGRQRHAEQHEQREAIPIPAAASSASSLVTGTGGANLDVSEFAIPTISSRWPAEAGVGISQ